MVRSEGMSLPEESKYCRIVSRRSSIRDIFGADVEQLNPHLAARDKGRGYRVDKGTKLGLLMQATIAS